MFKNEIERLYNYKKYKEELQDYKLNKEQMKQFNLFYKKYCVKSYTLQDKLKIIIQFIKNKVDDWVKIYDIMLKNKGTKTYFILLYGETAGEKYYNEMCKKKTKHFIYTSEIQTKRANKANEYKKNHPESYTTRIEYYLNKGLSYEDAQIALKNRQTTFSLNKCIEKYGQIEGYKRWTERQNKWQENFRKQNYSKISQELFWLIYNNIINDFNDIWFAELNKGFKNNEKVLKLNCNKVCKPDFLIEDIKCIIEFDGDYWHSISKGNIARDKKRDLQIKNSGYDILHISENDYKKDKNNVLKRCLEFINECSKK